MPDTPHRNEVDDFSKPLPDITLEAAHFPWGFLAPAPNDAHLNIRLLPVVRSGNGHRFIRLWQLQQGGFDEAIPCHLDGQKNVFVGICPRIREGGHDLPPEN